MCTKRRRLLQRYVKEVTSQLHSSAPRAANECIIATTDSSSLLVPEATHQSQRHSLATLRTVTQRVQMRRQPRAGTAAFTHCPQLLQRLIEAVGQQRQSRAPSRNPRAGPTVWCQWLRCGSTPAPHSCSEPAHETKIASPAAVFHAAEKRRQIKRASAARRRLLRPSAAHLPGARRSRRLGVPLLLRLRLGAVPASSSSSSGGVPASALRCHRLRLPVV